MLSNRSGLNHLSPEDRNKHFQVVVVNRNGGSRLSDTHDLSLPTGRRPHGVTGATTSKREVTRTGYAKCPAEGIRELDGDQGVPPPLDGT